ncbi:MAG: hypothetical protein CMJ76_03805 [Planctomycetaceae bacterium]|nr:hypothetical protein [Planctomycetaceae bacterium]
MTSLKFIALLSALMSLTCVLTESNAAEVYQLERGDIITVVNGEKIVNVNQYQRLVRVSNFKVEFSIRKSNGSEMNLTTTLRKSRNCNFRFGTDIAHNRGDGVRVTFVHPRGPGSSCQIVTKD